MKTFVTGATGFLGTTICSKLEEDGHDVVHLNSKNCDLTKENSLSCFNDQTYDYIYHLAAWTQAGDFCLYHPGEQWIINQKINTNVLAWWQKNQPQAKLICMGTSCAYSPDLKLIEENYLIGKPIESLFTYAMTKRMLYAGLLALEKQFNLKYLCFVPSTLYGPGYHTDGRQMHFIFDLIRKIIRGKIYSEPVILWGDGFQSRELIFVDDFAKMTIQLTKGVNNELINIGTGEEHTIRFLAKLICSKVDYDYNSIKYDISRYVGVKSKCLGINKLKNYLPVRSVTLLEIGLDKTIEWFWKERNKLLPDRT